MGTITLDTSNTAAFNNYVSIKDRRIERVIIGIVVIGIFSYLVYDSYQHKSTHKDDY